MLFAPLFLLAGHAQDLVPLVDGVRLVDGAREITPLAQGVELQSEFECGDAKLRIRGPELELLREGKSFWKLAGLTPTASFAACDKAAAYFTDTQSPADIKRVDLNTGKWLESWSVAGESFGGAPVAGENPRVAALVTTNAGLFALRFDGFFEGRSEGPQLIHYRVSKLDPKTGKADWSRVYDSIPPPQGEHAFLLAPMQNRAWSAMTNPLVAILGDVVVCAGGLDPLMRLRGKDGEAVWKLERPWEFERGYIGPSMWQHFIGRFGFEEHDLDPKNYTPEGEQAYEALSANYQARRAAFDGQWIGAIVAGPFVVEAEGRFEPAKHLLVITALAPKREWSSQLGSMCVYEIADNGEPKSLVALPRPVAGPDVLKFVDRVVIPCTKNSFACLAAAGGGEMDGFPGAGSDCIGRIEWFRQLQDPDEHGWLSSDPARDCCVLSPKMCVRVAGGGWVESADSKLFHFPLHFLDPKDSSSRIVDLCVPFEGKLVQPETNYRSTGKAMHTWGWYGLGLGNLELDNARLVVTISNSKQNWRFAFDVN